MSGRRFLPKHLGFATDPIVLEIWLSIEDLHGSLPLEDFPVSLPNYRRKSFNCQCKVVSVYFCNWKKLKYLILVGRLPCKSSGRRLTRKTSKILFRDSGPTFVITEDFRVSRPPEDFHVSCLVKTKYLSFIF